MTGVFCSLLNCTSSEECLFDNECTELPEEIANILRSDRACMPTGNSLVFGTTCPAGEICTDTTSKDMVASSYYCTSELSPILACRDFTCPERKICVELMVGKGMRSSLVVLMTL